MNILKFIKIFSYRAACALVCMLVNSVSFGNTITMHLQATCGYQTKYLAAQVAINPVVDVSVNPDLSVSLPDTAANQDVSAVVIPQYCEDQCKGNTDPDCIPDCRETVFDKFDPQQVQVSNGGMLPVTCH